MSEIQNLLEVINSGVLSGYKAVKDNKGGNFCQKLEDQFKHYFKVPYALCFNSATSALLAAYIACGARPGDEFITTPVTFSATVSMGLMAGMNPVFCDIDPETYNMDISTAPRKAAFITPVHLMGHPCDMNAIKAFATESKAKIIEDCSQAIGAKYQNKLVGTLGDVGIFSFNQGKQISCGEGGMLITSNEEIYRIADMLRNHGETQSAVLGYNFRMTELQAAVASDRFDRIDGILKQIQQLCDYANKNLKGVGVPVVKGGCTHTYCYYPLRIKDGRDAFQAYCKSKGIYFGEGGYKPLYEFPFYQHLKADYPNVESMYKEVAFTNIFRPPMTIKQVTDIVETVNRSNNEFVSTNRWTAGQGYYSVYRGQNGTGR